MTAITWTHVGNVGKFTVTPAPEPKEHYSSMGGSKELDKIAIVAKKADFELSLDEWTLDNAVMALLGLETTDTSLGDHITIMGATAVERQLKFTGSNDYGPHVEVILPHVFLYCKNAISLIGDDWEPIMLTGSILRQNPPTGIFGTWRELTGATGSAPLTSPNTLNYYIGKGSVYTAPLA